MTSSTIDLAPAPRPKTPSSPISMSLASLMHSSADNPPLWIASSISMTATLAPPCNGPHSALTPAEAAQICEVAGAFSPAELRVWFAQLVDLTTPQAIQHIRVLLAGNTEAVS